MINRIALLLFIGLAFTQDITIAVLEFEGQGVSQSETKTLTDRFRDEMFNTGIYIVLERGKMDEVLKEQGFQQTGCVTSECAVEVGNMLGVQQMIGGSIGKVGNIYTVSARVIDVQTGEVLKSANYDHIGDIGQLLIKGMKGVVNQLVTGNKQNNSLEISKKNNSLTGNTKNNDNSKIKTIRVKVSIDQINSILKLAIDKGISETGLNDISRRFFNKMIYELTYVEAIELIEALETGAIASPKRNKDVIVDGNTKNGRRLLVNCFFVFISFYWLMNY